MKKSQYTSKISVIALILMLTISVTLVTLTSVNAHDPAWQLPTHAFINVSPNPTGVNQPALIVVWMERVIQGADITNDIRFEGYTLTITKPDGSTVTVEWPIVLDTTSSAYTMYTPDQAGTYTIVHTFPGQTHERGVEPPNPNGIPVKIEVVLIFVIIPRS